MKRAVALVSGGMDSATLMYQMRDEFPNAELILLSFDYGQRHKVELDHAQQLSLEMPGVISWSVIGLPDLYPFLVDSGSALTDPDVDVPEGHYAADNMAVTVVPNRNAMMLSIAWAVAVAQNCQAVGAAMHAGDHFVYPDCTPMFVAELEAALRTGTEGHRHHNLMFHTPFIEMGKHHIAELGARLGVPYEKTWSCYNGGQVHCGRCGTCVERKEAFRLAEVIDPTQYTDPDYEIQAYRG